LIKLRQAYLQICVKLLIFFVDSLQILYKNESLEKTSESTYNIEVGKLLLERPSPARLFIAEVVAF